MVRHGCRNILQSDRRRGDYFNDKIFYSFYYKGVNMHVGIFYTQVEFFDSHYLRDRGERKIRDT